MSHAKKILKKTKPQCNKKLIELAYHAVKELSPDSCIKLPRIIPIPKSGGVLPLIPIFAGLSAAGSLAGGISGIFKTINEYKLAKKRLKELERNNKQMEGVNIGQGLRLDRYKNGLGLFLNKCKTKN